MRLKNLWGAAATGPVELVDLGRPVISRRPVRRALEAGIVGIAASAVVWSGQGLACARAEVDAWRRSRGRACGFLVTVISVAVSVAIMLCAAAVAATPAVTSSTASARFVPQSVSAISDRDWWVLGSERCERRQCIAIEHTNDGGGSFTRIPAPPIRSKGPSVVQLAFANRHDGFAWGSALWVTRDGGRRWTRVVRLGNVDNLVVAGGYLYALAHDRTGPERLWRRAVSGGSWRRLSTRQPPNGVLAAHGATVILEAHPEFGEALDEYELVSTDRGAHFAVHRLHTDNEGCSGFAVTSARVIWGYCAPLNGSPQLRRSVNDGRTFTDIEPPGGQTSDDGAFAAASNTTALIADAGLSVSPRERPYLTTDAGRHYVAAGPTGLIWAWVGFIDATHGFALATSSDFRPLTLYTTTDGGRSYTPVSFNH